MLTLVAGSEGEPGGPLAQIIHREGRWFDISGGSVADPRQPRISASRWAGRAEDRCEQESEIEPDCHVIGIALQPMEDVTVFAARKLIQSGPLPAGSTRVYEPGLPMRGIFRGSYDALHLHVPNTMIAEYAAESANAGCGHRHTTSLTTDRRIVDPVIERLARALTHAEALGGAFGQSYAEGISLAITAQLFGGSSDGASTHRPRVSGLSKWRMKRATEYMAANLAEPISLADIAAASGLSRMHFAAQFRAATGLRPHEYLLQRRIERARELLLNSRLPLVEIAFEVGFKTQAHFTTVFARFVGETPNVWRQRNQGTLDAGVLKAA
jgi:AraC family transcriptional regulator